MPATVTKMPCGGFSPTAARRYCGQPSDQVARHDAVLQDLARAVDVLDEGVQRAHALDQAGFEVCPGGGVDDARDRIEGEDLLRALLHAVDVEGDAHAQEHPVGAARAARRVRSRLATEKVGDDARASRARCERAVEHLVEGPRRDTICVRNGQTLAHGVGIHDGLASFVGHARFNFLHRCVRGRAGRASHVPRALGARKSFGVCPLRRAARERPTAFAMRGRVSARPRKPQRERDGAQAVPRDARARCGGERPPSRPGSSCLTQSTSQVSRSGQDTSGRIEYLDGASAVPGTASS